MPRAWYPWNGFRTGSVHGAVNGTLRPTFEWDAADGATDYQIQLDDSCTSPGFADCTFDSPELDERTTTTVFRPDADLPVSMSAPIGRRYYWRVRGCRGEVCGDWSRVMYLNVGRTECDLNGDGYTDFVANDDEVSIDVYLGTASGYASTRSWSSRSLGLVGEVGAPGSGSFPLSGTCGGDVNADGFSDLVIAAAEFVVVGGGGGYGNSTLVIAPGGPELGLGGYSIADPTATAFNDFGFGGYEATDSGGDLDGDGLDDVVVSAGGQENGESVRPGRVFVFAGASRISGVPRFVLRSPAGSTTGRLGSIVSSRADVDGDGTSDVAVLATTSGAYVFGGGDLDVVHFEENPDAVSLGVADLDGDRRIDLVTGTGTRARLRLRAASEPIDIVVTGAVRRWTLDVNDDGYDDLLIGEQVLLGSDAGAFTVGPRPGTCGVIGAYSQSFAIDQCFGPVRSSRWAYEDGWQGPFDVVNGAYSSVLR